MATGKTGYGYTYEARREALRFLESLRIGDRVSVDNGHGEPAEATVTFSRLSDGNFGSPESRTVGASLGPGRYTYDLTAHRIAMGELKVAKI
jgi:hypothetical protein